MLKLQTGYSMYFNKKNDRVGGLFQGVFKSQHIDDDTFFRYIYAYIHLNPAKLKNSKWKIQSIRLFANAQNPINIFGYKGFSPEVGGSVGNMGIDANVYPLYATYNFGVNVTF
jgi:hypothetical protein